MGTQKIVTKEEEKWNLREKLGTCLRRGKKNNNNKPTWIAGLKSPRSPNFHNFVSQVALEDFERQKAGEEEDAYVLFIKWMVEGEIWLDKPYSRGEMGNECFLDFSSITFINHY